MTNEERVASLHERMDAMKRKRERTKTGILSAAGAGLVVCLLLVLSDLGGAQLGGSPGLYSGSILSTDGIGVYVLIAVIAFMAGVTITVAIMRSKRKE